MKFIFLLFFIFFLNGCNFPKNEVVENIYPIKNQNKILTFDYCTNFSFISNIDNNIEGKLFIEYIKLDNNCSWNGFQRGYFEYLFKSTLKIKDMKIVEQVDYKNYEFTTYIIDNKYYLNLVYSYTVYEDWFIVDYNGRFTHNLMEKFKIKYEHEYLNKDRFFANYSNSLVRMNFINSYFSKERETRLRE